MTTSKFPASKYPEFQSLSEGLKLPTQIYYIEKDLWQSLSKLPVKVSAGLNEDLTSIMVSEEQGNNSFSMKFF